MTTVRRSLLYSMAETWIGLPLQIITLMILARLLTPAETGVFAVAAVFASLASMFRDFGVTEYLIQEKELDTTQLRAALTVNILISWAMALTLFVAAPFVADFYRQKGVTEVMRLQSLNFILIPFGAVAMAYYRRELNFKPGMVSGLLSNIATFFVAIGCALAGMTYMSLAWSSLAGVAASVATAMWFRPANFPRWPGLKGVVRVLRFGGFTSSVYVVGQLGRGAPEMVIGRAAGVAEVALFSRGGGLVELFNRVLLRAVMPVCMPYFAKGQRESGQIAPGYLQAMSYLTAVGWPAVVFLGLAAYPLVMVLYGTQWLESVWIAQFLCAAAVFELVHYLSTEALLAAGQPRRANSLQISMQLARIAGLLAVVPYGLAGACWGSLFGAAIGMLLAQRAMRDVVGLHTADVIRSCLSSALVACGAALPVIVWQLLVSPRQFNPVAWLAVAFALAVTGWLIALKAIRHPLLAELQDLAANLREQMAQGQVMRSRRGDGLADAIARSLAQPGVTIDRLLTARDNSLIYEARVGDEPARKLAIKCCLVPGTRKVDSVTAQAQFDALGRAHAALAAIGAHDAVPRPMALAPAFGAYAMAWIEGRTLTQLLRHEARLPVALDAMRKAGRWLALLHQAGPMRIGAPDMASKIEFVAEMQRRAHSRPAISRGLALLAQTKSQVAATPACLSWLHGDFKTDNLMVTAQGVVGIDVHLGLENSVENDIAQFLNHFELSVMTRSMRRLRPANGDLVTAFVRGHHDAGVAHGVELLAWLRLWTALTAWHNSADERGTRWLRGSLMRRHLAVLVDRLSDGLAMAMNVR